MKAREKEKKLGVARTKKCDLHHMSVHHTDSTKHPVLFRIVMRKIYWQRIVNAR